ncbi:fam-b protein [Plasmodium chabaudi adami]|uniref:Fam-b protein n=1 Tax=Plasmodium chabaudi adami TaxID=5826 RepID=A0A1C6W9L9_PLACE|nr:fam-b protein [Plasmodium chabaudi adami]
MRANILNFVFFSIIICSFEYAENELYFMNERNIYLERNIINLINNRILSDADNQFDLYDFYQSASSIANQFSDCDHDEEMIRLRNIIDSHIRKHKENNTLLNLNNADKKTKKLIYELQKELEETKKEIDNIRINELAIQPMQDKRVIKRDGNISVSEHEDFKQLENSENILETEYDHFEYEYNEIISSNSYKKLKIDKKINRLCRNVIKRSILLVASCFMAIPAGGQLVLLLLIPNAVSIVYNCQKFVKLCFKSFNFDKAPR